MENLTEVIRRLAVDGPLSPFDIGRSPYSRSGDAMAYSSVRGAMKNLEEEGLVKLHEQPKSARGGRRNTYWLTKQGIARALSLDNPKVDRRKLRELTHRYIDDPETVEIMLFLDQRLGTEDADIILSRLVDASELWLALKQEPNRAKALADALRNAPRTKKNMFESLENLLEVLRS